MKAEPTPEPRQAGIEGWTAALALWLEHAHELLHSGSGRVRYIQSITHKFQTLYTNPGSISQFTDQVFRPFFAQNPHNPRRLQVEMRTISCVLLFRARVGVLKLHATRQSSTLCPNIVSNVLSVQQAMEVDSLVVEGDQFTWGGPEAAAVEGLLAQLRRARRWVGRMSAATKGKPTLEQLEPLLALDPPPMQHPGALYPI